MDLDMIMDQLLQLSEQSRYDNLETIIDVAQQTLARILTAEEVERIHYLIEQHNISHKYNNPEKMV